VRYEQARKEMVIEQIETRGISDSSVLRALSTVPREHFVARWLRWRAYADTPLPIGSQQTISQPFMVASMTEALGLEGGERVLEIGTGSGYGAAVLAEISGEVYTLERIPELAEPAIQRLHRLGYANVHVVCCDGSLGLPAHAPYDAIVVTANAPEVPTALKRQLKVGGRLVIPVGGDEDQQFLRRVTRTDDDLFEDERLAAVRFVPLIGEQGW
jgi:protein-L-isoaspartate(D-aspartate) O-methyltransferase